MRDLPAILTAASCGVGTIESAVPRPRARPRLLLIYVCISTTPVSHMGSGDLCIFMEVAEVLLAQRPTPEHPSGAAIALQLAPEPTTPEVFTRVLM